MRLFLNVVFATAACVQCAVVSAQVPSPRVVLRLGMTGAEVRKAFGTPQIYRQSKPTRDIPSSAVGVLPPSNEYFDVYEMKTSLTAYELWINYSLDDSESFTGYSSLRLHPKTISPNQQAEADWIGSFFGRFQGRRVKPTASVIVERGAISQVMFDEDEGGLEGPVKASWKPQRSGN